MPHLGWKDLCWKAICDAEYDLDREEQENYGFKNTRYYGSLGGSEEEIRKLYRAFDEAKQSIHLIGRICVQYRLPAGDPCWMAKMIGSYV